MPISESKFAQKIQETRNPSFSQLIDLASFGVPDDYRGKEYTYFHKGERKDDRGTRPIAEWEGLCCYLVAYGLIHQKKLRIAFDNAILQNLPSSINIVDWGCGQGLATFCLIEYLEARGIKVGIDNIILIEPSPIAIKYAELYLASKISDERTTIKKVNKSFAELSDDDLKLNSDAQVIHLYSNILDVDGINMKDLSSWLTKFKQNGNLIISVSPQYSSGQQRINTFFSYIVNATTIYSGVETNKQIYGFTYNARVCRLSPEAANRVKLLSYYTSRQYQSSYRLDLLGSLDRDLFLGSRAFEIYAPFEIGTSYSDDPNPIFSVLSNMISRGLPTKASPFIEEVMSSAYGCSNRSEEYGGIVYQSSFSEKQICELKRILEEKDFSSNYSPIVFSPIAASHIQKTIVEALITGHLKLDEKWSILIEESDVPCAAIAIEDLKQMFENLVSLSKDYSSWKFPTIDLIVVNSSYSSSPLHLGAKVYADRKEVPNIQYDLVIDYCSSKQTGTEYQFDKYNVKSDCYFAVFASDITSDRYIYTTDLIEYKPITESIPNGGYRDLEDTIRPLEYFLQLLFRKKEFRQGQTPILNRALRNKSVIGLLPTGGGKSLTYQLAALLQPGVTIIIDPLKSLMKDQFDGLIANGIDCCTFINNDVGKAREEREYMIEKSQCMFAFMSPERLCIYGFRKRLQNMHESNVYFSYGVIDEVHCVSEWGQDFRFSYLHLGRNLYQYVRAKTGVVTLFGLTATASFDVLADVERELSGNGSYSLDSDVLVRCEDTNRLELQYRIIPVDIEFEKESNEYYDKNHNLDDYPKPCNVSKVDSVGSKSDALIDVINQIPQMERDLLSRPSVKSICKHYFERQNKGPQIGIEESLNTNIDDDFYRKQDSYSQAGIVFCPHKKSTDVSVDVCAEKIRAEIPDVGIFYSSDDTKNDDTTPMQNMVLFRDNKLPIMVATKAFGMGIDKPNVRFTINMNYSSSLESFVQEAGRAGRDRAMALSTILVSNYRLAQVKYSCTQQNYPLSIIKGHWFKEKDLDYILQSFGIQLDKQVDCAFCDPELDLVRVLCPKINKPISQCKSPETCEYGNNCRMKDLRNACRGWVPNEDAQNAAREGGIKLSGRNIEYQSPDYGNMMYFYNSNFPGDIKEKRAMIDLMSRIEVETFLGDTAERKMTAESRTGFLDLVLSSSVGTEVVCLISYDINNINPRIVDGLSEGEEPTKDSIRKQDIVDKAFSKAIYRMCCIGLIDDFTQNYNQKQYRVVCVRKADGGYYQYLKDFLMRYYPEQKAETEIERAKTLRGDNEIHRCLGYLTEFIYEKLAVKKKRAIDDIRTFCNIGLDTSRDWKVKNEELKDYIYYYFNSKFAKEDYVADNDEPYSLTVDTQYGKDDSNLNLVFKYIKVVDDEICGASGNPKDNIKHLQGAVRLILRSLTRENAIIHLLNVYCILQLREYKRNATIKNSLEDSYESALHVLWDYFDDKKEYYDFLTSFKEQIFSRGADKSYREEMELIEMNSEISRHKEFLDTLSWSKQNNIE